MAIKLNIVLICIQSFHLFPANQLPEIFFSIRASKYAIIMFFGLAISLSRAKILQLTSKTIIIKITIIRLETDWRSYNTEKIKNPKKCETNKSSKNTNIHRIKKKEKLPQVENRPISNKTLRHLTITRQNKKLRMTIPKKRLKNCWKLFRIVVQKKTRNTRTLFII